MPALHPLFRRDIVVRLDASPRYAGSSHDDAVARRLGFRAALIPGAFLYGHISRVALDLWGNAWLAHGTLHARFRRPAYNGDALAVEVSALRRDDRGQAVDVTIRNADGEELSLGGAGLPDTPPAPPALRAWPVQDRPATLPEIGPGGLPQGFRVLTRNEIITAAAHRQSLQDFNEDHPIYLQQGIVHAGMLLRQAMGDANRSARFPSPVILVSAAAETFAVARAGDRFTTSGVVTAAYERKGNRYFETEEVLIANATTPVARFRRTSLYAAEPQAETA